MISFIMLIYYEGLGSKSKEGTYLTYLHTKQFNVVFYLQEVHSAKAGKNLFWSVKNSAEILDKLKYQGFLASSVSTYDFSTLYTTLPHNLVNLVYGDLVYKLKKIVGSDNFSAQFIKIISHYKKIGYNINVLQQTACLVVNPITVGNFAFLFNCTPVGRTSDSMMVPT